MKNITPQEFVEWLEKQISVVTPFVNTPMWAGKILIKARKLLIKEKAQEFVSPAQIIGSDGIGNATGTFIQPQLTPAEQKAYTKWITKLKRESAAKREGRDKK